ncbi:hypothetical protein NGTWS1803_08910 [Mycolicibacterium cyprinidarum]|nr:hypothetical protein NGTWS1803_08910 [Mycolicibacterium sp. NGTWS1803]
MRGILATAAAVTLTTLGAITAPEATLAANVRTITGYTAGGKLHWEMNDIFQGEYCSASSGNSCAPVQYMSGVPLVGEFSGLTALTVALWVAESPTTVLGFSQGSLIATEWLRRNSGKAGAPSPEDLSFVLVANPLRKYGGVRPAYDIDKPTPDTGYDVLDIAIEYDGVSDFPDNPFNLLALANAFAGSQYVHIYGYDDVDLENADKLVWKVGNTTYVLIRNKNIPLLQPLRDMGLGALADSLNGPLKSIIDSAYTRNYPGMVSQKAQDSTLKRVSMFGPDLISAEPVTAAASAGAAHRSSVVTEPTRQSNPGSGPESSPAPEPGGPTEDPKAAAEADDQQSADAETEPSAAEVDATTDTVDSEADRQDDDITAATEDAEVPSGLDSTSEPDETEPSDGGDADGSESDESDSDSSVPSSVSSQSDSESESTSGS